MKAVLNVTADVADLGAMLVEARKLAGLPAVDQPQLEADIEAVNAEPTTVDDEAVTDEDGQQDQ